MSVLDLGRLHLDFKFQFDKIGKQLDRRLMRLY